MDKVAQIGCLICRDWYEVHTPAELHHIGDSSVRSDFLVVPLCPEHHRGASGRHGLGERGFNARYRTSELALLGLVFEALTC